jgi:hydrogenase maturation protease
VAGLAQAELAVIGCGNATRGDDGVGSAVLGLLAARGLGTNPAIKLLDAGTDGVAVMFAARDCRRLIVVDACRTGASPGSVFETPGEAVIDGDAPPLATHEFRWDHALAAGRRIYRDAPPPEVTVFLIEAESLAFGIDLSPVVAVAAERVAERIATLAGAPS